MVHRLSNLEDSFLFKSTGRQILKLQELVNNFEIVNGTDSDNAYVEQSTVFENYFFITLYSLWESDVYKIIHS
ncbi:TPA: hypothetical protein ACGOY4_001451, partial [Streptococcus suis]